MTHATTGIGRKTFRRLWRLANTIRQRLGIQGYLLDTYLESLLRAANGVIAFYAVSEGQQAGVRLRELCRDIIDREKGVEDRSFYVQALAFIETHPLNVQERHTRVALYFTMLSPDFLTEEVAPFSQNVKN